MEVHFTVSLPAFRRTCLQSLHASQGFSGGLQWGVPGGFCSVLFVHVHSSFGASVGFFFEAVSFECSVVNCSGGTMFGPRCSRSVWLDR